jgi:hypothetical protein
VYNDHIGRGRLLRHIQFAAKLFRALAHGADDDGDFVVEISQKRGRQTMDGGRRTMDSGRWTADDGQ